jgi:hypothetical protein
MKKLFILIGLIILSAQITKSAEIVQISEPFLKMMAKEGKNPEIVLFWGNPDYQYIKLIGNNRKFKSLKVEFGPNEVYQVIDYHIVQKRQFYVIFVTFVKK